MPVVEPTLPASPKQTCGREGLVRDCGRERASLRSIPNSRDLSGRYTRASSRLQWVGAGRPVPLYLAIELGAYQPIRRFLMGTGCDRGHRAPLPQPRVTPGRRL